MLDEPEKTKIVVVKMLDDGSIKVALDVTLRDGPHSASGWISKPGTADFIEFGTRHRVTKPGQISTITSKFINGEWHETEERSGD